MTDPLRVLVCGGRERLVATIAARADQLRQRPYREAMAAIEEIAGRVPPRRIWLDMMSMLATGWLPWGVHWATSGVRPVQPHLHKRYRGGGYAMCCGHVMSKRTVDRFVAANLLRHTTSPDGDPWLVITEAGRHWLAMNWDIADSRRRRARAAGVEVREVTTPLAP